MQQTCSVMFARFPYGAIEHPNSVDWLVETVCKAKADPRIRDVFNVKLNDTPITMTRNRACKLAKDRGADFLVMLDNDMSPDLKLPGAKPFWDTSFDYAWRHYPHGPCAVAAPYCGPPPHENVYIFRWATYASDDPNPHYRLEQFTREEAAGRGGHEIVAALPTGLFILDVRALDRIPAPWFRYQWTDQYETHKASTEDVYFTRNLSLAGVPQVVNWDAWAGHVKPKTVGKPVVMTSDQVSDHFREALTRRQKADERLIMVGDDPDQRLEATTLSTTMRGFRMPCATTQSAVLLDRHNGTVLPVP